jgi:hypothetical protein
LVPSATFDALQRYLPIPTLEVWTDYVHLRISQIRSQRQKRRILTRQGLRFRIKELSIREKWEVVRKPDVPEEYEYCLQPGLSSSRAVLTVACASTRRERFFVRGEKQVEGVDYFELLGEALTGCLLVHRANDDDKYMPNGLQ